MKKHLLKISAAITSLMLVINASVPALATGSWDGKLTESEWDRYDLNYIYYYNPEANNCTSSTGSILSGNNKLYNGEDVLSAEELRLITQYKPAYQAVAKKYNIPWQVFAALHYREHSLRKSNPANGEGVFQLHSYTNGGTNENAFLPAGDITDEEFKRQLDITAKLIVNQYGAGLNLYTDDGIKTMFFRYNGTATAYKSQARDLGYTTEKEMERGEGSPYVMNLADKNRDSRQNNNWRQDISDDGANYVLANRQRGAFVVYAALGGSSGYSSCDDSLPTGGNGDITKTAIELAWPTTGHGLNARETYKKALIDTGVNRLGDKWSMMGASCDAFVATVFRYSGVDKNFVCCGVSGHGPVWNYVTTHPEKFREVTEYANLGERALKSGDILIRTSGGGGNHGGHIELYITVDGKGRIASASHSSRTGEILPYSSFDHYSNGFRAYRWVGK